MNSGRVGKERSISPMVLNLNSNTAEDHKYSLSQIRKVNT